MTIRCRTRFSTLLLCLPLGLCVASTARAASDDDDGWTETKGPRGERSKSEDSDSEKTSKKDSDKDSDKKKNDSKDSDKDSDENSKAKKDSDGATAEAEISTNKKRKRKHAQRNTPVSLAALGTYGTGDSLMAGVGLRGGAHLDVGLPIYVGGVAQYFFGLTDSRKSLGVTTENTNRAWFVGAEGGFEIEATTDLWLRPMFGVGIGVEKYKHCNSDRGCDINKSSVYPTLSPGITGLYYLGDFFFGADFRYLIVPGSRAASGALISATLGLKF